MASTIALLAAVALTLVAALLWRTRRVLTVGQLKDFAVSRQWLMQHQSDD
jgi:hypothetical protein